MITSEDRGLCFDRASGLDHGGNVSWNNVTVGSETAVNVTEDDSTKMVPGQFLVRPLYLWAVEYAQVTFWTRPHTNLNMKVWGVAMRLVWLGRVTPRWKTQSWTCSRMQSSRRPSTSLTRWAGSPSIGGGGAKAGVSTLSHLSGVFRGKVILRFWEVSSEMFCRLFGVLFGWASTGLRRNLVGVRGIEVITVIISITITIIIMIMIMMKMSRMEVVQYQLRSCLKWWEPWDKIQQRTRLPSL